MRLTSIGVLLFSLWSQITNCGDEPCLCGYNTALYSVSVRVLLQFGAKASVFRNANAPGVSVVCGQCWETRVGQEMYKLTVFDFIIIVAVTILVEFPRK